jgi:hypothetical protein
MPVTPAPKEQAQTTLGNGQALCSYYGPQTIDMTLFSVPNRSQKGTESTTSELFFEA